MSSFFIVYSDEIMVVSKICLIFFQTSLFYWAATGNSYDVIIWPSFNVMSWALLKITSFLLLPRNGTSFDDFFLVCVRELDYF